MKDTLMIIFFIAWLLCGCSVEAMLDDWRAGWTAVVALIVAILCIAILNWHED